MSEATTEPQATPSGDSVAIRELRTALDEIKQQNAALRDEKKQLEKQISDADKAKLDETERLRVELSEVGGELEKLRAASSDGMTRIQRFEKTFSGLYESELATVPEEHREKVAALSASGEWDDRLSALRTAVSLLPVDDRKAFGTSNSPGDIRTPEEVKKIDLKALPSWDAVLSKPA